MPRRGSNHWSPRSEPATVEASGRARGRPLVGAVLAAGVATARPRGHPAERRRRRGIVRGGGRPRSLAVPRRQVRTRPPSIRDQRSTVRMNSMSSSPRPTRGTAGSTSSRSRRLQIPGTTERLEIRTQDPAGSLSAAMLTVHDRRYPVNVDEVAISDGPHGCSAFRSVAPSDSTASRRLSWAGWRIRTTSIGVRPRRSVREDHARRLRDPDPRKRRPVHNFRSDAAASSWNIERRRQSEKALAAIGVLIASTVAMCSSPSSPQRRSS